MRNVSVMLIALGCLLSACSAIGPARAGDIAYIERGGRLVIKMEVNENYVQPGDVLVVRVRRTKERW